MKIKLITVCHPCGDTEDYMIVDGRIVASWSSINQADSVLRALGLEFEEEYKEFEDEDEFFDYVEKLNNQYPPADVIYGN